MKPRTALSLPLKRPLFFIRRGCSFGITLKAFSSFQMQVRCHKGAVKKFTAFSLAKDFREMTVK